MSTRRPSALPSHRRPSTPPTTQQSARRRSATPNSSVPISLSNWQHPLAAASAPFLGSRLTATRNTSSAPTLHPTSDFHTYTAFEHEPTGLRKLEEGGLLPDGSAASSSDSLQWLDGGASQLRAARCAASCAARNSH